MRKSEGISSRQRYVLIIILFFHTINTYMDRACISSAKDAIVNDLGLTEQMMGYIFGIFALGYALFQIPSGWIADRYGPRGALTAVVSIWSCFTMLTGAAFNALSMLVLRFLFGAGEAGAFPGATRAFYKWLPVKERGIAHGINISGSRIGAAISLFFMPFLIRLVGWRMTFVLNGLVGIIWAVVWLWWFRDDPKDNPRVNNVELDYIETGRMKDFVVSSKVSFGQIFTSVNMFLTMFQYFASNMTFFISFTWLLPYLVSQWGPGAELYAPIPLFLGAAANWTSGVLTTQLFKKGYHIGSRRTPAILGFALGVIGLILATQTNDIFLFVIFFSIAIFGVDMTLSPSWALCMDIGGNKSGAVSASMNMVGNIGSSISAILFPFFVAHITMPLFAESVGTANSFFIFAAVLNSLAILSWLFINPKRELSKQVSEKTVRIRMILSVTFLVLLVTLTIIYRVFFMK